MFDMNRLGRFSLRNDPGRNPLLHSCNLWFFVILSLNFWLIPMLPSRLVDDFFTDSVLAATLLIAVGLECYADRRFWRWGAAVGATILAAIAIEEVFPATAYIENAVFAVCFAAVTVLYFRSMIGSLDRVTGETVFAAACTYILIGMMFASIFGLIVEHDAAAFEMSGDVTGRYDLLFYSFATLTTLGAPDVIPVSDLAKMLTVFEAMIGLIYIAILVAAIVGSYSAKLASHK